MKKAILLIGLMASFICTAYSQTTTSYGSNAGTGGLYNSFFGHNAGIKRNQISKHNASFSALFSFLLCAHQARLPKNS